MAKFSGVVGFSDGSTETSPGVWVENIVEKSYTGDIVRNMRKLQEGQYVNDDLTVSNAVSIVADAYANQNFFAIRYISWMGSLWIVSNVDVQAPRLILTLGGVYNGPTAPAP